MYEQIWHSSITIAGKGAGKRPPAPGLGEIKASEDKENRAEKKAKSGATRSDNDKPKGMPQVSCICLSTPITISWPAIWRVLPIAGRKRNAEEAGSKVEAVQKPSGKTKKRKAGAILAQNCAHDYSFRLSNNSQPRYKHRQSLLVGKDTKLFQTLQSLLLTLLDDKFYTVLGPAAEEYSVRFHSLNYG